MTSAEPAATQAGRTYEQYRNDLIVRGVTVPAVVVFLVTALYATSEAFYAPQRFWPARWAYLAEMLTALVACWLCRGRLRQHAQLVLLGADVTYTVGVLVQAAQPTTTIAGAALAIAIKVMATAVFLPWQPRLQYISASVTIVGYWTVLYLGGRVGDAESALFQTLGPCIAAVLSAAGAAGIDRNRRAIFEARAWLQLATESAKVVLWTCDLRTLTMRFSSGRKRVLGRDESEIPVAAQWDLVHPDDRTQAIATLQAHLQKRTSLYENERRMLHADGSYRWVLIRSTTAYDIEGQPCVQYGADIDITERKTLEAALREARAALEIAVTAARVGLWDWDLQTGETHYADSWRTLFGYSPAELDGSMGAWSKIVHPDDLERLERSTSMATAIVDPTAHYEEEFQLRHRDGTYRWVLSRARVLRDAVGIPQRMLGAHVDISELKRAEDAARRSARQIQALFEASVDVITILEADGTFRDVSPSIRWLLGYEVSDVVGRDGFDFVHPDDCAALQAAFASRIAEPGHREPVQYRLQRADGSWVYVESTLNSLLSDPAVRGLVVTTRDITERTRLYAEMAALNRELEARVAERTVQLGQANAILTERITECERVDRALRESEERFALAVAGSMDGIWDWNAQSNDLYLSPRCSAMLGFDADELQPDVMEWEKRVHPDDIGSRRAAFWDHLHGQAPFFEDEHRVLHKDGTYRWILSRGLAVRDASGKPVRVAGSMTDITERKRIEEGLRASEQKFRTLAETVAAAIVIHQGAELRYVNSATVAITGYSRDELLSMAFWETVNPEFQNTARAQGLARQRGETVRSNYEMKIRRKDASDRWVDFTASTIDFEGGPAVLGTAFDITERRRAQERLRQSEERFRKVFDEGPLGMVLIGVDYRFIRANAMICRILGYTEQELTGLTFSAITHPDNVDTSVGLLAQVFAGALPFFQIEKRYITKTGGLVFAKLTATVIRDDDGRPLYGLGMIEDITAHKRAEEAVRQHLAELAHVSRVSMLGEMAGGLAHEINQPLAAIVNYARGCVRRLEGGGPPGELGGALEAIAAEALRAAEIIRRIRRLARKEPPRRTAMDLNQLVADAARLMEADSQEHGVTMRVDLAPGLPLVDVDGIQIQQVCVNLVRNGLEAMSPVDSGKRELLIRTSMPQPDTVEVAVCDAGVGLPAELGDHVFDAFVSTKSSGLGMGLSISRSILEAHGGRLWVTANTERGATFRFTLSVPERETSHAE